MKKIEHILLQNMKITAARKAKSSETEKQLKAKKASLLHQESLLRHKEHIPPFWRVKYCTCTNLMYGSFPQIPSTKLTATSHLILIICEIKNCASAYTGSGCLAQFYLQHKFHYCQFQAQPSASHQWEIYTKMTKFNLVQVYKKPNMHK